MNVTAPAMRSTDPPAALSALVIVSGSPSASLSLDRRPAVTSLSAVSSATVTVSFVGVRSVGAQ